MNSAYVRTTTIQAIMDMHVYIISYTLLYYNCDTLRCSLHCPCGSLTVQTPQPEPLQLPHDCQWRRGTGHSNHSATYEHACHRVVGHKYTAAGLQKSPTYSSHSGLFKLTLLKAFLSHPNLVISSLTMSANPYLAAARRPVQPSLGDNTEWMIE